MAANYDGLTRNTWPGTWSPTGNHPIVLDAELRGSLRTITGNAGNRLTDITGQRLEVGMLVYVINDYTLNGRAFTGGKYYKYISLAGESRNAATGELPNSNDNWELLDLSAGGGGNGYTGSIGYTGSAGTANVTVALSDSALQTSNVVTQVNSIQFDKDAGFTVNDLGGGAVKIGGGTISGNVSTFRYWEVNGQNTLVAQGTDTVRFIAGRGVTIETDTSSFPQTIIISAPVLTVNFDCGYPVRPFGLDAYYDGGDPYSIYGGITPLDSGGVV